MRKLKLEKRYVQYSSIFFLLGFAAGIIMINVLGEGYANQTGIISDYYIRQYKYMEIDPNALFFYICQNRLKWIFLVWIIGFTVLNLPCVFGCMTWFGFSAGILISLSVLKLGIYGILFFVTAMLPQSIIYIPGWIFFLQYVYKKNHNKYRIGKERFWKNWDWNYMLVLAGTVSVFLLGILTESYTNPWIMKQILKFF